MTIIYIRHADDIESTHRHDARITKKGKQRAKKMAQKLLSKYGLPSFILCSPFKRARSTAGVMRQQLPKDCPLYIDRNLSRYFCSREKCEPSLYATTGKYDTPIYESKSGFHRRIDKHLSMIQQKGWHRSHKIVWCITHALVYKYIALRSQVKIPSHIPFLDYFVYPPSPSQKAKKRKNMKS
jgi:broad specificity phosphatase PhoE